MLCPWATHDAMSMPILCQCRCYVYADAMSMPMLCRCRKSPLGRNCHCHQQGGKMARKRSRMLLYWYSKLHTLTSVNQNPHERRGGSSTTHKNVAGCASSRQHTLVRVNQNPHEHRGGSSTTHTSVAGGACAARVCS